MTINKRDLALDQRDLALDQRDRALDSEPKSGKRHCSRYRDGRSHSSRNELA